MKIICLNLAKLCLSLAADNLFSQGAGQVYIYSSTRNSEQISHQLNESLRLSRIAKVAQQVLSHHMIKSD